MKLTLFLMVVGGLCLVFAGCPGPPQELRAAEIAVNGLTCDMCVSKVETAVNSLEGIEEVTVDLNEKFASIRFDEARVSLTDIEHAIAEAGFSANGTPRSETAHSQLPSCCQ